MSKKQLFRNLVIKLDDDRYWDVIKGNTVEVSHASERSGSATQRVDNRINTLFFSINST